VETTLGLDSLLKETDIVQHIDTLSSILYMDMNIWNQGMEQKLGRKV